MRRILEGALVLALSLPRPLVNATVAEAGHPSTATSAPSVARSPKRAVLDLVDALALRFGPVAREPVFSELRPKLAQGALVPSRVFEEETAWPRRGSGWRAVEFAGGHGEAGYKIGVRGEAPEPATLGEYRGQLRLHKLARGRFEWTGREELSVGASRPADLATAFEALLRGAEANDEASARAAIAAAFPRAQARLGLLLRLDTLGLVRDPWGATNVTLTVRVTPDGLLAEAPHYAEFLERYVSPMQVRLRASDAAGALWWSLDAERCLWTLRLRVRDGRLVPLEGDGGRRMPESVRVTLDYATRMGRHRVGAKALAAEAVLTRTTAELGFVLRFREKPEWDLPFLAELVLGAPLRYPFEGPGSEAGWAARETEAGARLERHYRARVGENLVLRWLGGMTSRALSEFRASAEQEADRFHGECLLALRADLAGSG